jgi:ATP-binding cassette subfamily E protein 1
VHGGKEEWGKIDGDMISSNEYVIVVEHDLAILDYMSDYVQCLYGEGGAYGVVTSRSHVRNGINQFLACYIPADNMRFRPHELTFKVSTSDFLFNADGDDDGGDDDEATNANNGDKKNNNKMGNLRYPDMSKTRQGKNEAREVVSQFKLHVKSGSFRDGECIVMMGENGTGKSKTSIYIDHYYDFLFYYKYYYYALYENMNEQIIIYIHLCHPFYFLI